MTRFVLLTALLAAPLVALAGQPAAPQPPPDDTFRPWAGVPTRGDFTVYVSAVHDGDTFTGCLLVPVKVRVFGINAPELVTPEGKVAQVFAARLVQGKMLPSRFYGIEKFGRTLGDLNVGGRWFGELMIEGGQAKKYDGHGPRP